MHRNILTANVLILGGFLTLSCADALAQPQIIYQSPGDRPQVVLPGAKPAGTPLEGEVKKVRRVRSRHGVTCFGVSNAASRHIIEYVLNSAWSLPVTDESYLT